MHYFFTIIILITVSSCYQIDRNCENYHTGHYNSHITVNGINYTSTFSRTENLQVEIFEGKIDSSMVRWINDCEVVFTTINPKNILQKKPVLVKILRTFKDSYDFEYSYVGETTKQKGNATILE